MGGNTFTNILVAPDAKLAFRALVEDAKHQCGHGGYSGTIAEKDSFVMIDTVETEGDALALSDRLIDNQDSRIDDKWGPAGCIEIKSEKAFLFFGWASS